MLLTLSAKSLNTHYLSEKSLLISFIKSDLVYVNILFYKVFCKDRSYFDLKIKVVISESTPIRHENPDQIPLPLLT